jgi:hypothetical protein
VNKTVNKTATDKNKRIEPREHLDQVTGKEAIKPKTKGTANSSKNTEKPIHRLSTHSFLFQRFCHSDRSPFTTSANRSHNINPYTTSPESLLLYDQ